MRIFITVLFLILSFHSLTKADEISEFEIEGISLEIVYWIIYQKMK